MGGGDRRRRGVAARRRRQPDPFVIGMPNLEGDPAGTFPDVGEGAEAAVKFINEQLGGIGADLEAGTPGRPIELEYCAHLVDQNEAQACANEIADANPNTVEIGVDFFTPLMYPLFQGFPVDRDVADLHRRLRPARRRLADRRLPDGLPSSAADHRRDQGARQAGRDLGARTPPGTQCWQDTQERFYQYYADTAESFEFQGFPYDAGRTVGQRRPWSRRSPTTSRAPRARAVYFGVQSSDCAEFIKGLAAPAWTPQIYIVDSLHRAIRCRAFPRATA